MPYISDKDRKRLLGDVIMAHNSFVQLGETIEDGVKVPTDPRLIPLAQECDEQAKRLFKTIQFLESV